MNWLVPMIWGTVPDFVTFKIFLWAFSKRKKTCILSFVFYIKTYTSTCGHYRSYIADELLICCLFVFLPWNV